MGEMLRRCDIRHIVFSIDEKDLEKEFCDYCQREWRLDIIDVKFYSPCKCPFCLFKEKP